MKNFSIRVLGANSAIPVPGRFPTSFVLQYDAHLFLLDCGEGSQVKMSEFQVKRSRINQIFITHLHGDHIFGLPGLLNSYNLNQRKLPLSLFGPAGLKQFIETISNVTGTGYNYELIIREIEELAPQVIGTFAGVKVTAFPLSHRIPTYGYRFDEIEAPINIYPEAIEKFSLSIGEIQLLKKGLEVSRGNEVLPSDEIVYAPHTRRSFAFCTDTKYDPSIVPMIQGVDCLYHEATYLNDMAVKAEERLHATAHQAALIAREAAVGQLIIGHYSSRYKDLSPLLLEAQEVFPNTHLAIEGDRFEINGWPQP